MLQVRLLQSSQCQRHPDAVVRAQCRVFRNEPTVAHHRLDRIALEIMHRPRIGLAHHIEMTLQDHARHGFTAGAGGFLQDEIADRIDDVCDAACLRPFDEVLFQRFLTIGRTGDRAQRGEVRPDRTRLQIGKDILVRHGIYIQKTVGSDSSAAR